MNKGNGKKRNQIFLIDVFRQMWIRFFFSLFSFIDNRDKYNAREDSKFDVTKDKVIH